MEPSDAKVWFSQTRLYRHKHTLFFLVSAIATKDGNKGPTYDRYGLHGNTPQEKKSPQVR